MKRWEIFEECVIAGAGLVVGFTITIGILACAGAACLGALGVF